VGMNSIIEEHSYMESQTVLASGSVLKKGSRIQRHELWGGNPATFLRNLRADEIEFIDELSESYNLNKITHENEFALEGNQWREAENQGLGEIIGYFKK